MSDDRQLCALLDDYAWTAIRNALRLSVRELQIVTSLIEDRIETDEGIGRALGISPHTVHTHLERLYKKIGVANRVGLVLRMRSAGLLESRSTAVARTPPLTGARKKVGCGEPRYQAAVVGCRRFFCCSRETDCAPLSDVCCAFGSTQER
jgi:DNA-binding CsgD family transcriptional regulator